jgi:hypothetical protein
MAPGELGTRTRSLFDHSARQASVVASRMEAILRTALGRSTGSVPFSRIQGPDALRQAAPALRVLPSAYVLIRLWRVRRERPRISAARVLLSFVYFNVRRR